MKGFIILCILLSSMYGARLHHESYYQKIWCDKHNGIEEVVLEDRTRVDCVTKNNAVEVDFANKWAECVGQALYYGNVLKLKPTCLIIVEDEEKDMKYLKRIRSLSKIYPLDIFIIKPQID